MSDFEPASGSRLARMLRNPVKLRRRAWVLAAVACVLGGIAGSGWQDDGALSPFLMAVAWILAPLAASGIGLGEAFFLRHGIGQRRISLTMALSTVVALVSCAVLAILSASETERVLLSGLLYFILVLAVIAWLSGVIGLGVGRGEGYLSRRIQDVDDTGW